MKRKHIGNILVYLILIVVTLLALFPLYWMIGTSMKDNVDIFDVNPQFLFKPTNVHYTYIFTVAYFPEYFKNSIVIGLFTTFLSIIIAFPSAYSLSRLKFRYKTFTSLVILAGRMLPPVALIVPVFLIMQNVKLLNTLTSIILMHTTLVLPFSVWMLRSYFMSIPLELEEAAFIDGAGRFLILHKIIAPLSLPGIFATAIFAFVESWNEYIFSLTLSSTPAAQTLPVGVAGFITARGVAWGELSAAGTLMVIPVIIFSIFMQKYLKGGMFPVK
jgi:multiple sugar transport system permease protein